MEKWPGSDDPIIAKRVEEEYVRAAVEAAFAQRKRSPTLVALRAIGVLVFFVVASGLLIVGGAKVAWQLGEWIWRVA